MSKQSIPNISKYQVAIVILTASLTVSFLDIHAIGKDIHTDTWIPYVIMVLISPLVVLFTLKLASTFPNEPIITYLPKILGKKTGFILGFIISTYYLIISVIALRVLVDLVKVFLLPNTPCEVQLFISIFVTFYAVWYGMQSVFRITEFIVPPLLIMFLMLLFLTIFYVDFSNILPIAENGAVNILKKTKYTFTSLIGVNTILFFYPFIKRKNNLSRTVLFTTLGSGAIIITLVISIVAMFGYEISDLYFPAVSLFQKVNISVMFLERISLFLLIITIPIFFMWNIISFYSTVYSFTTLFKLEDHTVFLLLLTPFYFFLSNTPLSIAETFSIRNSGKVISNLFIFLPVLLLFIKFIKEKVRNRA